MLPEGDYQAVAVPVKTEAGDTPFVQFGTTKNGKNFVSICFQVTAGEHAGQRITWFGYFVPSATRRTVEALRTCGFTGDDLMAATIQPLSSPVTIVIGHEEYNGKVSAKVKWVNRSGGGGPKIDAMKANDLRSFAASMKLAVRDVPELAGRSASSSADSDDDIKF